MKIYIYILWFLFSMSSCVSSNNIGMIEANCNGALDLDEDYCQAYEAIQNYIELCKSKKSRSVFGLFFRSDQSFQIDSLLLFNNTKTKLMTTINSKDEWPGSESDKLRPIYGIKIEGSWYFFMGGILILPRNFYQYDVYEDMSFEELSYLARTMRHRHFLIDKGKGKYKVDHEKVENYITPGNLLGFWPGEPREGDEAWITVYHRKMADTISIEEIEDVNEQREKAAAEFVWKPAPKRKKTPIFETKAWKNRHKK